MPEPDFNMPTIYSPKPIKFALPSFGNSRPRKRRSAFSKGGFLGFPTDNQYALAAVNNALAYPQNQTVNVDGSAGVMASLKGAAAAILSNMGSTGDAPIQATPAAYNPNSISANSSGILGDPIVLIGLVFGAGVIIYLVNK